MAIVSFNGMNVGHGDFVLTEQAKGDLIIDWMAEADQLYTVIFYDMDAPYPSRNINSPYLHYLLVNSIGKDMKTGDILSDYRSPSSPPDSPPHRYVVWVGRQRKRISKPPITVRRRFDVAKFIKSNNLETVGEVVFTVGSSLVVPTSPATLMRTAIPTPPGLNGGIPGAPPTTPESSPLSPPSTLRDESVVVPTVAAAAPAPLRKASPRGRERRGRSPTRTAAEKAKYFVPDSKLSPKEKSYCRCVLHVAAQQPSWCLVEHEWFKTRGRETCYNPYAVCAASTKTSSQKCGANYDYKNLPPSELKAYAKLNKIPIPSPYSKAKMLENIAKWKIQKEKEGRVSPSRGRSPSPGRKSKSPSNGRKPRSPSKGRSPRKGRSSSPSRRATRR